MTLEATILAGLASIKAAMPSITSVVRYAGVREGLAGSVSSAICTGIDRTRTITEEGIIDGADATARYESTSEPAAWGAQTGEEKAAICGEPIEVLQYGQTEYRRCRVIGRKVTAGTVRLDLQAEFA